MGKAEATTALKNVSHEDAISPRALGGASRAKNSRETVSAPLLTPQ